MHACWIGVATQFTSVFLKSTRANYYIGTYIDEIDLILLSAKPTNEIPRVPRSITLRALFKASENREFVLFYSPVVFENLLPPLYFRHWLLFVNSMRMLFVTEIPPEHRRVAKMLLHKFVKDIPKLYGSEQMTYNVHLLTHLMDTVEYWGAPWSYSAFLFEHFGGSLAKNYHGTTQLPKQIMSNFRVSQQLLSFSSRHIPHAEENVKNYFEKMGFLVDSVEYEHDTSFSTKGKGNVVNISPLEIETLLGRTVQCNCAVEYFRIATGRKVYSTASYDSKFSRCNSIVSVEDCRCYELKKMFVITDQCSCRFDGKPCILRGTVPSKLPPTRNTCIVLLADHISLIFDSNIDPETGINLTKFMTYVDTTASSSLVAIYPRNIKYKCIPIVNGDKRYVIINDLQLERG
jgi:hypothetical protein